MTRRPSVTIIGLIMTLAWPRPVPVRPRAVITTSPWRTTSPSPTSWKRQTPQTAARSPSPSAAGHRPPSDARWICGSSIPPPENRSGSPFSDGTVGGLQWGPDGRWIYFSADLNRGSEEQPPWDGSRQVWRISPAGGQPQVGHPGGGRRPAGVPALEGRNHAVLHRRLQPHPRPVEGAS